MCIEIYSPFFFDYKGKESVDTALALQIPTALEVKDVNVSHPQQQSIESLEIVQLLKATNPQGNLHAHKH